MLIKSPALNVPFEVRLSVVALAAGVDASVDVVAVPRMTVNQLRLDALNVMVCGV
jgi:hypothetical protein